MSPLCTGSARTGFLYKKQSLQVQSVQSYRYWQFDQLTREGGGGLEVGEFVLVNNGVYVSGGTWYNGGILLNYPLGSSEPIAATSDGILTSRAFLIASPTSTQYIQYDHGSPVVCTGFKYASFFRPAERYISAVRVQGSNDNVNFTVLKTFSLTAYTTNNGDSVNELSPEYVF